MRSGVLFCGINNAYRVILVKFTKRWWKGGDNLQELYELLLGRSTQPQQP